MHFVDDIGSYTFVGVAVSDECGLETRQLFKTANEPAARGGETVR
jgi:hypothetical protein